MFVCMMGGILVNNCCLASDREGVQISLAILPSPYFLPLVLLPILYQQSTVQSCIGKKLCIGSSVFLHKETHPFETEGFYNFMRVAPSSLKPLW
jgi:hypothetical protein